MRSKIGCDKSTADGGEKIKNCDKRQKKFLKKRKNRKN